MQTLKQVELLQYSNNKRKSTKNKCLKKEKRKSSHCKPILTNGWKSREIKGHDIVQTAIPSWFNVIMKTLERRFSISCKFEYDCNWKSRDNEIEMEDNIILREKVLDNFLQAKIEKTSNKASHCICFTTNAITNRFIDDVQIIYCTLKESGIHEILLHFIGTLKAKNSYLVIWLNSKDNDIKMQYFSTSKELTNSESLENYFLPCDIRKNPQDYAFSRSTYIKKRKPCRLCLATYMRRRYCSCRKKNVSYVDRKSPATKVSFHLPMLYTRSDTDLKIKNYKYNKSVVLNC